MDSFIASLILNYFTSSHPELAKKLRNFYTHPEEIFSLPLSQLSALVGEKGAERIKKWDRVFSWEEELRIMEKENIKGIPFSSPFYPGLLKEIPLPPLFIYVKGEIPPEIKRSIAIVGTRTPSPYGRLIAETLSRSLAERGVIIVSGMARGIDTFAHRGALEGGETIAVLGSGLLCPYPAENRKLMDKIAERGGVISEYPLSTPPQRYHFPYRNRIISGLSMGVVVVEARKRSGALITASVAAEQGREVFAVPGQIDSPLSEGTNTLIQEGAKLVREWRDVWEEFILLWGEPECKSSLPSLSPEEEEFLKTFPSQPRHLDYLIRKTTFPREKFHSLLLKLISKGRIKELPGKFFVRIWRE